MPFSAMVPLNLFNYYGKKSKESLRKPVTPKYLILNKVPSTIYCKILIYTFKPCRDSTTKML